MLWRAAVVLLGVLALLVGYYWVHKPIDAALALRFGGALLDAATVGALFVVAGGVGRRSLARLDLTDLTRAERIALEAVIGLGIIGIAALALGMAGLFRGVVLWLLLGLTAVGLRAALLGWLRDTRELVSALRFDSRWAGFLAAVSLTLLALALVRALAPPHAWDAMTYHLVAPQRYLADGRIAAYADNHFFGFSQLVEILFGVVMSLFGRDTSAALVHFGFGVLALFLTAGLARRYANAETGWLAALLLLSAHSIWLLLGWAYVDLAVLAYGAAALVAAGRWRETRASSWLALLGVIAGLAFGVKYTAVALAVALALYVLWHAPRYALSNGLRFGGAAFLFALPWLLKGALLYGNPIYPFLFGGLNWDVARSETFSTLGSGLLAAGGAWQLPVLPIAATVLGVESGAGFAFTAGPWLLTAPLLLLVGWRWLDGRARRLALDCLLLGAPLLVFWIILAAVSDIGAQTRLVMMALPLAAAAGALGFFALAHMPDKPIHLSFVVRAAFTLTLILSVIDAARATVREQAIPYLFAAVDRDAVLDANLEAHAGAMRALATLPPGSRVRLMWEPRSYHCPASVTCIPDLLFDQWARPLQRGQTPGELLQMWKSEGDYLLVWETGYAAQRDDPRFAAENAQFPAARDRWLTPVWTDGVRYTLYGWRDSS